MVAQCRHNPALGNLHGTLYDRFVSGFTRPRRQYAEAVMNGKVMISRIEIRVLAAGFCYTRFGVIGNGESGNAAPISEGMHVSTEP
jgi:hypothetical protein